MSASTVTAGRQTRNILCFLRSRILRHEIVEGTSWALFEFLSPPDHVVRRGARLSALDVRALRTVYVLGRNGAPMTYVAPDGGTYLALPVAAVAPNAGGEL